MIQISSNTLDHSSALVVPWVICLHNLFQESQRQTKIVLDQKWVVLFEYEVHFAIRPKLSLNAPFLYFFGKIKIFWKKAHLKPRSLLEIWWSCVISFVIVKYEMSAFTSTKNQINWRKIHCFSSFWNSLKKWILKKKSLKVEKVCTAQKKVQKVNIFFEISSIFKKA